MPHRVAVTFTGGRYGYTPTCSCGWVTRGYVAEHAAQQMADGPQGELVKCKQELCPSWTGHGCVCEIAGIETTVCPLCGKPAHDYRCGAWPA